MPTTSYTQEENLRLAGLQHHSNLAALAAAAQANMGLANAGSGLCGGLLGGLAGFGSYQPGLASQRLSLPIKPTLDTEYEEYVDDVRRMQDADFRT